MSEISKRVDVERSYYSFVESHKEAIGTQRSFGPTIWEHQGKTYPILYLAPFESRSSNAVYPDISVPDNATIRFGIAINPEAWDRNTDGATFAIKADQNLFFSYYLDPRSNPYHRDILDFEIGLADYAGQVIDISFVVGPNLDYSYDWTGWVNPRIVTDTHVVDVTTDAVDCDSDELRCLSAKLRNNPSDSESWYKVATSYEGSGLWSQALAAYVNAAKLGGTSLHRVGDIYYHAGTLYINRVKGNKWDLVIDLFDQALASDSFAHLEIKADSYRRRGEAYWRSGDLESAIDDFKSAIEIMPECYWHMSDWE